MNDFALALYVKFQNLASNIEGQDLVEYSLLCSLIALALIAGISSVATSVNGVFSRVSTSLA